MAGEWLAFGGALDFYHCSGVGHNDVEVGLGGGVFAVVEIEEQVAIMEADADGGYGASEQDNRMTPGWPAPALRPGNPRPILRL